MTKNNTNSDFGYVNVLINNNSNSDIIAEYNETRTQPILTNMNDFQLGVSRLKIPTISMKRLF